MNPRQRLAQHYAAMGQRHASKDGVGGARMYPVKRNPFHSGDPMANLRRPVRPSRKTWNANTERWQ